MSPWIWLGIALMVGGAVVGGMAGYALVKLAFPESWVPQLVDKTVREVFDKEMKKHRTAAKERQ